LPRLLPVADASSSDGIAPEAVIELIGGKKGCVLRG
jgi:hypothetical protein